MPKVWNDFCARPDQSSEDMTTFLDLLEGLKAELIMEKQANLLYRMKKDNAHTANPAQTAKDKRYILDVKLAEDGTVRTYLSDSELPVRNYPDRASVLLVANFKRLAMELILSLKRQNWFERIITLLAIKNNFDILPGWFEYQFDWQQVLLKEKHWSQPIKEVRRVLKGKINEHLIDAISAVLEYDSAYRYRFQDIVAELNKNNGVVKELKRLLTITAEREVDSWQKEKWNSLKFLVNALYLMPKTRKLIREIIQEVNIDEIKFSKEDIYWTRTAKNYNYGGNLF